MVLRSGDRFVFFGDSITEANPGYSRLVAAMVEARHPDVRIDWLYRGVGGNTVFDLIARCDRDVLAAHPTWVSMSIGVNDVWHRPEGRGGVALEEFRHGYGDLLDRITAAGSHAVCLTPTVLGEDPGSEANRELERYAEAVREQARARAAVLVDMRSAFLRVLGQRPLTVDGVHMNLLGNVLMAETLYSALAGP